MSRFGDLIDSGRVLTDVRLGSLTTYKLGGPARLYIEIQAEEDLTDLAQALSEDPQPVLVVGRGSNLIISDQGWPGLAIRFGFAFTEISFGSEPDCPVTAGAATTLPRLARETVNRGRGGLEFYVGIPGSVGGAIRTNAGGHGSETADWLLRARIFDLETAAGRTVAAGELAKLMGWRYVGKILTARVAPTPRSTDLLLGVMNATEEQCARLHLAGARTVGWEV